MTRRVPPSPRGSGLLEFAVISLVLSALAFVLLDRVRFYQEMAERTAVELTVMNMRSSMRFRVADLLFRDKGDEIARMAGGNPAEWLEAPPPDYIGARKNVTIAEIPPGSWCFDASRHELLYRVRHGAHFVPAGNGEKVIRLRVVAVSDRPRIGAAAPRIESLALDVDGYQWF